MELLTNKGANLMPDRKAFGVAFTKRSNKAIKDYFPRPIGGHYDAYSFLVIVDALLNVAPDRPFTSNDMHEHLKVYRPEMRWQVKEVGRVIQDIAEGFDDAYPLPSGAPLIARHRYTDGWRYVIRGGPETSTAFARLHADLVSLVYRIRKAEAEGFPYKKVESPLLHCPSVQMVVRDV